jgi:putative oxidoreductase
MLKRLLGPLENRVYAVLRITLAAMFAFHGLQKIFGILRDSTPAMGSQLWLGGLIELVCGGLMMVGLFTRSAAFLSSGTMAVAYTQYHWKLKLGAQLLPAVNDRELALVYSIVFLYVACKGPGLWSVEDRSR